MTSMVQVATPGSGSFGSGSIAFTSNITAGDGVIFLAADTSSVSGGSVTPSSGGDTYTQLVIDGSGLSVIWYCLSSAGGYKTIDFSSLGVGVGHPAGVYAYETPPLTAVDRNTSDNGSSATFTSGTTSTTTQASEVWVGAATAAANIANGVPGAPWTSEQSSSGGATVAGYQFVTSEATATFTGACGNGTWGACIGTFKLKLPDFSQILNIRQAVKRASYF